MSKKALGLYSVEHRMRESSLELWVNDRVASHLTMAFG
jgi:hypothetical protein